MATEIQYHVWDEETKMIKPAPISYYSAGRGVSIADVLFLIPVIAFYAILIYGIISLVRWAV